MSRKCPSKLLMLIPVEIRRARARYRLCGVCGDLGYKATTQAGLGWLCKKHHRFQQMRNGAESTNKTIPSYEELEGLLALEGMLCGDCGAKMVWTKAEDAKRVITLQHDAPGCHRFLCFACNNADGTRSLRKPRDSSLKSKICTICKTLKTPDKFYEASTPSGLMGPCSQCKQFNIKATRLRKRLIAERDFRKRIKIQREIFRHQSE